MHTVVDDSLIVRYGTVSAAIIESSKFTEISDQRIKKSDSSFRGANLSLSTVEDVSVEKWTSLLITLMSISIDSMVEAMPSEICFSMTVVGTSPPYVVQYNQQCANHTVGDIYIEATPVHLYIDLDTLEGTRIGRVAQLVWLIQLGMLL